MHCLFSICAWAGGCGFIWPESAQLRNLFSLDFMFASENNSINNRDFPKKQKERVNFAAFRPER